MKKNNAIFSDRENSNKQDSVAFLEYQNFNILKNTNYNFYFQNFKIVIFFFQKLGSEEPNSGLHRLVPTLDNVHLHLDKVQSLN